MSTNVQVCLKVSILFIIPYLQYFKLRQAKFIHLNILILISSKINCAYAKLGNKIKLKNIF